MLRGLQLPLELSDCISSESAREISHVAHFPVNIPQPPTPASSAPLIGANPDAKKARVAKDAQKWINESGPTRKDLAELLQHQMEPHASRELLPSSGIYT